MAKRTEFAKSDTEKVALWMIRRGYATGHGDTVEDMLAELEHQAMSRGINQYVGKVC